MERFEKKNKGNPQRTPRSRSNRFPSLRGEVIGGNVDLDLLSCFPQKDARIIGGIERKGKLFKVNNGGERVPNSCPAQGGRMGIYTPLQKCDRWGNLDRLFLAWTGFFRPKICPPTGR
jgi:hypothetical protein